MLYMQVMLLCFSLCVGRLFNKNTCLPYSIFPSCLSDLTDISYFRNVLTPLMLATNHCCQHYSYKLFFFFLLPPEGSLFCQINPNSKSGTVNTEERAVRF
ncbi:hypothetical protein AMECASPLE_023478 [Ameca splendens]|uniref:Secreted protein n=1 Tax=Ameca splendens TaxID=208324 RepID=A0ABV0YF86_9TELE